MRPAMAAPACQSCVAAMPTPERLRRQSSRPSCPVGSSKPPRRTVDDGIETLGGFAVNAEIRSRPRSIVLGRRPLDPQRGPQGAVDLLDGAATGLEAHEPAGQRG